MTSKRSLAEANPKLASEWHPTRNGSLSPSNVTPNSGRKVWWKCGKGADHEWPAVIQNRNKGIGCPICSNQRVAISNSLGTVNQKLAKQWHPTKNGDLTPFHVLPSTNRRIWWKCPANPNHEWEAKLNNRANGRGCPICANKLIAPENSLAGVNPELAKQWHPTKNGRLSPYEVAPSSIKRIWWKCPRGSDHEWQATVNHRATGTGCPVCNPVWSIPELRIYCELSAFFPSIQHRASLDGIEVDVYVPELKFGIEYDGVYWHAGKLEKDKEKSAALSAKLLLVRIREEGLPLIGHFDIAVRTRGMSVATIRKILAVILEQRSLPEETSAAIRNYVRHQRSWIAADLFDRLYTERKVVKVEESLSHTFPRLAAEWHPTKNVQLNPEHFTPGSGTTVWWLGPCGHEWQDTINHRSGGRDCPKCRYRKASGTWRAKRSKGQLRLLD